MSITACAPHCHFTGAAQYLSQVEQEASASFPSLVHSWLPDIDRFMRSAAPSAPATDLVSLLSDNSALPTSIFPALPTGQLGSRESSTLLAGLGPLYTSVIVNDVAPLVSMLPTDLPATGLSSWINANPTLILPSVLSVLDTLIPELQTALSSLNNMAEPSATIDTMTTSTDSTSTITDSTSISGSSLTWPLPFTGPVTTAFPLQTNQLPSSGYASSLGYPASSGYLGTGWSGVAATMDSPKPSDTTASTSCSEAKESSSAAGPAVTTIDVVLEVVVQDPPNASASVENAADSGRSLSATHKVQVGGNGQTRFFPNAVDAAVGDVIEFQFLATNHTVTQSSLEQPCQAIDGFDSGFQYFNPTNQQGVVDQRLLYLVTNSQPRWFFCRQTYPYSHCTADMIFSINGGDLNPEFHANAARTAASTAVTASNVALASSSAFASRSPIVLANSPSSACPPRAPQSILFLTIASTLVYALDSRIRG